MVQLNIFLLLISGGISLSPTQEMCIRDSLLTLVGDILSAAELESNRYTMKIAPHSCNKLCREAITLSRIHI